MLHNTLHTRCTYTSWGFIPLSSTDRVGIPAPRAPFGALYLVFFRPSIPLARHWQVDVFIIFPAPNWARCRTCPIIHLLARVEYCARPTLRFFPLPVLAPIWEGAQNIIWHFYYLNLEPGIRGQASLKFFPVLAAWSSIQLTTLFHWSLGVRALFKTQNMMFSTCNIVAMY